MSAHAQHAILVVDLGFGDAGKGSITDFLTRTHDAHTVVRFNGGAQAAHNVVTPDGRQHTFAQFGSGTFVPGVRTLLSRFMLVEPYAMFNEEDHLRELGVRDAFARTLLDRRARIITPFQVAANRLRELVRGVDRHGSCGMGVGETVADSLNQPDAVITAGEMPDSPRILRKLRRLRDLKWSEIEPLLPALRDLNSARDLLDMFTDPDTLDSAADNYAYLAQLVQLVDDAALRTLFDAPGTLIFEGAQGVLLDENHGFAPYTTWSDTTFNNALDLLKAHAYAGQVTRLGVLRTYSTRHGAGPFVTEDTALAAALPELHNADSPWQQAFRVGHFDVLAARYALDVCGGVDSLALTHVDYLARMPDVKVCTAYHMDNEWTHNRASLQGESGRDTLQGVRTPDNNLDPYFAHDGNTITAIKVRRPPDWAHQQGLTQHLFRCIPRYESVGARRALPLPDAYLSHLENTLGVPITLTSHGQTARDKQSRRG